MLLFFTCTLTNAKGLKPDCSIEMVTRNCEFYKDHQNEILIKLPDGTYYSNPKASKALFPPLPNASSLPGSSSSNYLNMNGGIHNPYSLGLGGSTDTDALLLKQQGVIDIIDDSLATPFKMYFIPLAAQLLAMDDSTQIKYPAPLTSRNAKLTQKTVADLKNELKESLGEKKYSSLINFISEDIKINQAQMKNYLKQKALQEAAAKEVEQRQHEDLNKSETESQ